MKKHTCNGCKDRFQGCHSICPTYIAIHNERQKEIDKTACKRKINTECKSFQLKSVDTWERWIR